jgi:hypothetical protein
MHPCHSDQSWKHISQSGPIICERGYHLCEETQPCGICLVPLCKEHRRECRCGVAACAGCDARYYRIGQDGCSECFMDRCDLCGKESMDLVECYSLDASVGYEETAMLCLECRNRRAG